jgi:hypothetical protein
MAADDDVAKLKILVEQSPLLPEAELRRHWLRVIDWLPAAAREELVEILAEMDDGC